MQRGNGMRESQGEWAGEELSYELRAYKKKIKKTEHTHARELTKKKQ